MHVEKCVHTLTESFRSTQRQINAHYYHIHTETQTHREIDRHTHKCKDSLRRDFVNS